MESLGRKIAYFRKSKGLSIKKLAENVCDESTIYRLENGKQLPRLEILNDICMKLEIPFKALFPFNEEVERLKKLCREATYAKDYLSLAWAIEQCEKVMEECPPSYSKEEFHKFVQWHRAILLHEKDNNISDSLKILTSLVSLKSCGSELDISIMNSIGLIHLSTKNVDEAYKIYKVIYPKINKQKIVEDLTLLPRVGYNYAFALYSLNNYQDALPVAQEVLLYLEAHHLMYSLGKVYHMIGILSKKNGYIEDAKEAFQNAILVFTLTKNQSNLAKAESDLSNLLHE